MQSVTCFSPTCEATDGRKGSADLAQGGFSAAEPMATDRDNAVRLFPRLTM
jgi:hypothetical protein